MEQLTFTAKILSTFKGNISNHIIENEDVYNTVVNILTAMSNNNIQCKNSDEFIKILIDTIKEIEKAGVSGDLGYVRYKLVSVIKNTDKLSNLNHTISELITDSGYEELKPLYKLVKNSHD